MVVFGLAFGIPLNMIGLGIALRTRFGRISALLGLVLVPLLSWQAWIAARMIWAVNMHGGCICWAYMTYEIESFLPPSAMELAAGPFLLAAALGTAVLRIAAVCRIGSP